MKREIQQLIDNPLPGISAGPKGEDFFKWEVAIQGPEDTVYEGGVFKFEMDLQYFPFDCPKMKLETKIMHHRVIKKYIVEEDDEIKDEFCLCGAKDID